jgi:16S rRNA (cytosine1402-N4)-methyltransferase
VYDARVTAPPRHPQRTNRRQRFPRPRPGAGAATDAVVGEGATASPHRPVMPREVLRCLQPRPGDMVVDATLGGGGHAELLLARIRPGGRLLGLDVDPLALPHTEARLRAAGYDTGEFIARHGRFGDLRQVLARAGIGAADLILVDLGVSTMQHDTPARGFNFKTVGPLDMRMDPSHGETAAELLARLNGDELATLLVAHADEPHARLIATLLTGEPVTTTHALERVVRVGLNTALPALPSAEVKLSVRRTLQALRIAVNDEFTELERLLDALPGCLAPAGRVAILTFHSGEDRRVKKAFQAGQRAGVYASVAREVIRSTTEETRANRRASSAKLRWAVRAARPSQSSDRRP